VSENEIYVVYSFPTRSLLVIRTSTSRLRGDLAQDVISVRMDLSDLSFKLYQTKDAENLTSYSPIGLCTSATPPPKNTHLLRNFPRIINDAVIPCLSASDINPFHTFRRFETSGLARRVLLPLFIPPSTDFFRRALAREICATGNVSHVTPTDGY
jgi:hypothetical protein